MPFAGDPHVEVSRVDDRAGLPVLWATRAASSAGWAACDSLPPNPPPIRVQVQTTMFCRSPRQWATTAWISLGFWVEECTVIWPPSPGNGEGGLGLEVEMLLAAGAESSLDHVLGPRERGLRRRPARSAGSGR